MLFFVFVFFEDFYGQNPQKLQFFFLIGHRCSFLFYKDEERFCSIRKSVRVEGGGCDAL